MTSCQAVSSDAKTQHHEMLTDTPWNTEPEFHDML